MVTNSRKSRLSIGSEVALESRPTLHTAPAFLGALRPSGPAAQVAIDGAFELVALLLPCQRRAQMTVLCVDRDDFASEGLHATCHLRVAR